MTRKPLHELYVWSSTNLFKGNFYNYYVHSETKLRLFP